jgi:hypothetical protein
VRTNASSRLVRRRWPRYSHGAERRQFREPEGRSLAAVADRRISIEAHDAISPLSIGDIVDRSVTLAVRRWRTLAVLVLIEALPVGFIRALLPTYAGPADLVWLVVDVLLVALLYPAAVLTTTAPTTPAPGPMLQAAARRYGASLATFVLSSVWLVLWLSVSVFGGVLAMLPFAFANNRIGTVIAMAVAGGAAALALLPRAGLVATTMLPIVILERRSPWDALMLAQRRVNHAGFLRSSLLGLAVFAVTIAPILVIGATVDGIVELTHVPALRALDELIADAVSLGLGIVLSTVAALDLRARFEGADLEAVLDAPVT